MSENTCGGAVEDRPLDELEKRVKDEYDLSEDLARYALRYYLLEPPEPRKPAKAKRPPLPLTPESVRRILEPLNKQGVDYDNR